MDFDAIFEAYYTQYRVEADIPLATDDEYVIAMRLANEAVNRWSNYDNTFWRELFDTNQSDGSGSQTIKTGVTIYDAPDNMQSYGGFIKVTDAAGNTLRTYPILEPQDAQFRTDSSSYAYFTGDPNNGFALNINPAPDSAINGMKMNYVYYKQPTLFTTGTDVSEMGRPYFIVHRMLANRFRGSRNPYASDAKNDAEDVLKTMQMINNSGSWGDPWKMADNSGAQFGDSSGGGRSIFS